MDQHVPPLPSDARPLQVGPERFTLTPSVSARTYARWLSVPEGASEIEQIEYVIENIAAQVLGDGEPDRFRALWDRPDFTHEMLLTVWGDFVQAYTRRPTSGPSPSGPGSAPANGGTSSTPASSSPAIPASPSSPTTSDGS